MALTQTQLASAVAERAQLSKADANGHLSRSMRSCWLIWATRRRVRIGDLVQLTVRVKPAQKPRKGRNLATGEQITIVARPASVALHARPLTPAKEALPSGTEGAPSTRRVSRDDHRIGCVAYAIRTAVS